MASQFGGFIAFQTASDGFFLNLSWVMLHLSAPFMGGRKGRLATIDASYCAARRGEGQTVDGEFSLVDFSGETKLVPPREGIYTERKDEVRISCCWTKTCSCL